MKHQDHEISLNPEDRQVKDLLKKGDDFMKIEIYKMARRYYEKALAIEPQNPELQQKVRHVINLQKRELKTIAIIVSIMAIVVVAVVLF